MDYFVIITGGAIIAILIFLLGGGIQLFHFFFDPNPEGDSAFILAICILLIFMAALLLIKLLNGSPALGVGAGICAAVISTFFIFMPVFRAGINNEVDTITWIPKLLAGINLAEVLILTVKNLSNKDR